LNVKLKGRLRTLAPIEPLPLIRPCSQVSAGSELMKPLSGTCNPPKAGEAKSEGLKVSGRISVVKPIVIEMEIKKTLAIMVKKIQYIAFMLLTSSCIIISLQKELESM